MPFRNQMEYPVTWDQVAAFRLARHHLMRRAPAKDLAAVAGDIAGVQAQLLSAAQASLWSRVSDIRVAHIDEALKKRSLVKAACMRQTLFLVPPRDLAIFVRGSARRAEKEIRWTLGKGVPERNVDAAIETTLAALDEPRTRLEIAERVCRALGTQVQEFHGGGWGNRRKLAAVPVGHLNFPVVDLLHLVAARGVICYGPYRGNEPSFVRADAWIPHWKDVSKEQAEELLWRRYLQAFGPATVSDFSLWSGMTLKDAREIWARKQSSLAAVNVRGWKAEILRQDFDDLVQAQLDQLQTRLLPYFDTFLLGHKERQHLVPLKHQSKVYRAQGWIAPVVLIDGRVAGIWEYALEKNRIRFQVKKFEPIPRQALAMIEQEAQDFARFLGYPDTEMQINSADAA
jgi:hypothetical protein